MDNFGLFNLSEEDEENFLTLEPYKQEDFLIGCALRNGWVRVRFCESKIFVSAVRSPHIDKLLSKVGEAIIECGYPLTSIVRVMLLEDAGDYLSVPNTYDSASKETLLSLISDSYTPLQSGQSHAILNSPDMDYKDLSGEARTFLDAVCKKVQHGIPRSTISPITNLTWRVAMGSTVLLEISVKMNPHRFEYFYLDGAGNTHTGSASHKSELLSLVLRVGK
jgi:hypothetical protein